MTTKWFAQPLLLEWVLTNLMRWVIHKFAQNIEGIIKKLDAQEEMVYPLKQYYLKVMVM
jgi:hypothetical protein